MLSSPSLDLKSPCLFYFFIYFFFSAVSFSASARSSSSRSLPCSWEQANKNFYSCFLKTRRINGCFLMCSWSTHHLSTCLSAWLPWHSSSLATLIFCFHTFCSSKIQQMSTPEHIPITILLSFQVHHLLALFSQNHGVCPPSSPKADVYLTLALKTLTDSFLTSHTPNMCSLILSVPSPFAHPWPSYNLLSLLSHWTTNCSHHSFC